MTRATLRIARVLTAGALSALAGCAVPTWVKPYEQERLADPLMRPLCEPLAERHLAAVRQATEGARGAVVSAGGGCGRGH
jgi:hypothetical protein